MRSKGFGGAATNKQSLRHPLWIARGPACNNGGASFYVSPDDCLHSCIDGYLPKWYDIIDEIYSLQPDGGKMKHIILSTDAERYVYLAPDEVAKRLREYCLEFIEWLYDAPEADQYRKLTSKGSLYYSYNHTDFVGWLNQYRFTDIPTTLVECIGFERIPAQYKGCPKFNF